MAPLLVDIKTTQKEGKKINITPVHIVLVY